jgi:16S rRNA (adenine1518-N6/adenine1519-N6)-dimethyltransferase
VFYPAPRVESAIVVLRRTADPPPGAVVDLVHAAFAHRRKALAGSLALAPNAPAPGSLALTPDALAGLRDGTRAALEAMGHPADARAERLTPANFLELAQRLELVPR